MMISLRDVTTGKVCEQCDNPAARPQRPRASRGEGSGTPSWPVLGSSATDQAPTPEHLARGAARPRRVEERGLHSARDRRVEGCAWRRPRRSACAKGRRSSITIPRYKECRVIQEAVLAAIFCTALTAGVSGAGAATSTVPSAFARTPVASDQLPGGSDGVSGEGLPSDSRRIATLQGPKRSWSVYIFKQTIRNRLLPSGSKRKPRPNICLFVFTDRQGGGGGCSPTALFFGPDGVITASSSRVLAGVASDRVARVVVVGSRGTIHEVSLSRDKGFIFNCRAYNGCACVISRLQAFDKRGNRIANENWTSRAPNCRRK